MDKFTIVLKALMPFAIVATALSLLILLLVQHDYRIGQSDPQAQMSRDAAEALEGGVPSSAVIIRPNSVEIEKNLSPFLIIYNDAGEVRLSGASLAGATPLPPPSGVFDSVRERGTVTIVWKPREDVSVASVVTRFGGDAPGFVLAGRSLADVEYRVRRLRVNIALSWAGILAATLVVMAYSKRKEFLA